MIIDLRDEQAKLRELVGGKAASLAQILSWEVPSSEGFCITTAAYQEHLKRSTHQFFDPNSKWVSTSQPSLNRKELAELRESIIAAEVNNELRLALRNALSKLKNRLGDTPLRIAVRSSATEEDSAEYSFAGQYNTYLNIFHENGIIACVKKCWASLWSERAYSYRMKKSFDPWKTSMAVIIQEFVPSEASGTLFTANPVTGNVKEAVVEACWGLGELLVSGKITPDLYYIHIHNKLPALTKKMVKNKRKMAIPEITEQEGTLEVAVPDDKVAQQVLSDQIILDLVNLGKHLSELYGHPCDIEWAWHNMHLFILQARPITTLGKSTR